VLGGRFTTEHTGRADGLEAAVDQAIAACGSEMRSTNRALIVEYLESGVSELMKAISHAYVRGRFQTYPARNEPWRK
jgi:hypothetical protein